MMDVFSFVCILLNGSKKSGCSVGLAIEPVLPFRGAGAEVAGVDELAGLVVDLEQVDTGSHVILALLLPALLPADVAEHEQAVVDDVAEHDQFLLLGLAALAVLLQHVVAPDELRHDLLALLPARPQVFYEVHLRDVVAGQRPDAAPALRVGQAVLQDGEALGNLETALDGQEAVEVGLQHLVTRSHHRQRFDEGETRFVGLVCEDVLEAVVGL